MEAVGAARSIFIPRCSNFFTTLYAFVIGFAIVTLWSAFLTAKTNVTREAESMMIVYRTAKHLPGSEPFRQAVASYVKTVIDVEWARDGKRGHEPGSRPAFRGHLVQIL